MGFRSVSLPGGLGSIPIPTFSVSTRPLSSYFGGLGNRLDPVGGRGPREYARQPDDPTSGRQPYPGRTVTNNYYSLSATDFDRRVQEVVIAPQAQAFAVGAP